MSRRDMPFSRLQGAETRPRLQTLEAETAALIIAIFWTSLDKLFWAYKVIK